MAPKAQPLPLEMQYRSHPWHGLSLGEQAPEIVNCYIEIVPTDTIKYELDKATGLLKVDRPQKYSSLCPTLYGLLPQTYAGERVAAFCGEKTGRQDIVGDGDPLDVCVLTENTLPRGDIIMRVCPIGGFRLLDGDEADDKIIAVMIGDFLYEKFRDISECPSTIIERLHHYFLTYKDAPDRKNSRVQITHTYGAQEAREIINLGSQDYFSTFRKS
jgi:inorganic pyrophosphatase